jgi:hypothetical protein
MLGRVGRLMSSAAGNYVGLPTPDFDIDFLSVNGLSDLPAGTTFARASGATTFDASGALIEVAANALRQFYNPVTGVQMGLLLEEAATNNITNPRAEGAVVGAPGTLPSPWAWSTAPAGLTLEVASANVVEDGMSCIDIRVRGTQTGGAAFALWFEGTTRIAALLGEVWTGSFFARLVAGSMNNATVGVYLHERNGTGAAVANSGATFVPTSARIGSQRRSHTRTLDGATTAFIAPNLLVSTTLNQPVDFTLRIGAPQCERAPFPSTPILPPVGTPGVTTRARDLLTMLSTVLGDFQRGAIACSFALARWGSAGVGPDNHFVYAASNSSQTDAVHINAAFDVPTHSIRNASTTVLSHARPGGAAPRDTFMGAAVTWGDGGGASAWDGTAPAEDATVPSPVVGAGTRLRLSQSGSAAAGEGANAIFRRLRVWNTVRLTPEQTQKASAP